MKGKTFDMKPDQPYILMLEDDEDDRYITQTFFAANNFDVGIEFLSNSDDVLPWLENCIAKDKHSPSLILLDKHAPADGGIEVLKRLKSHPLFKVIPVVMISG